MQFGNWEQVKLRWVFGVSYEPIFVFLTLDVSLSRDIEWELQFEVATVGFVGEID